MGFSVADRVKEKTTTTGVGSVTLNGDYIDGFQPFASGIADGETTFYVIDEPVLNNDDIWEVGFGTFVSGTLSRDIVFSSSNSGQKIDLRGSGVVSITYPAERSVYLDNNLNTIAASGLLFTNDPEKILDTQNGDLYWNDKLLSYESNNTYVSGIAVYASGLAEENQSDNIHISGVSYFASGQSINNYNDIVYVSGIAAYASGAIENLRFSEYQNINSDTILSDLDTLIFVDSTDSEINVYMPLASGIGGKQMKIKRAAGNNLVTIHASGSETIDGQTKYTMQYLYQSYTLVSNNTNWFIT